MELVSGSCQGTCENLYEKVCTQELMVISYNTVTSISFYYRGKVFSFFFSYFCSAFLLVNLRLIIQLFGKLFLVETRIGRYNVQLQAVVIPASVAVVANLAF